MASDGITATAPDAGRTRWALLRHHLVGTLRLAGPVMVARSGSLLMITADVIMTGRADARQLAYYGLGVSPAQVLFVLGLGLLLGTVVLTAQAEGRGRHGECAAIWHAGMVHGLVAGLAFAALLAWGGEPFYLLTGQAAELAHRGAGVLRMFAWGLPGMMLYVATTFFLDGISRPKANMVLMMLANGVNIALNWLFIYDHGSYGGMGAEGAALATSITRWLMWLGLAGYALLMPGATRYGVGLRPAYSREIGRRLNRLGLPGGVAHGLESAAFLAIVLFAGLLGTLSLATYQIVQSLFTISFMLAIGVATASGVRVGNAVGRGDRAGVAWAGWVGIAFCLAVLLPLMVVLRSFPGALAAIYSTDAVVLAAAPPAILVGSLFIVVDGTQGVVVGALRGRGMSGRPRSWSQPASGGFRCRSPTMERSTGGGECRDCCGDFAPGRCWPRCSCWGGSGTWRGGRFAPSERMGGRRPARAGGPPGGLLRAVARAAAS